MTTPFEVPEGKNRAPSRWHLFWFIPLCVFVFLFVEQHTISLDWQLFKLAKHRWSWMLLVSPSAWFCWGIMLAAIIWPLQGLVLAFGLMKMPLSEIRSLKKQIGLALLLAAAVLFMPIVWDFLLWGSFPLPIDNNGAYRLRFIPFLPWPDGSIGQY
jgi:hypothetical protein